MMKATDAVDDRLRYGARLVLSREPTDSELATLHGLYQTAVSAPGGPKLVKVFSSTRGKSENERAARAALTAVASVLFNLDAALTR
jgi:hypothetical protein